MLQWPDKLSVTQTQSKLVILDRDGVINHDSPAYIKSPQEWNPLPNSIDAIAKLTQHGFMVAVATNQSAINRGLINEQTLLAIHNKMLNLITQHGGDIAQIVYCPHRPDENCLCRKPKTGMFEELKTYFQHDLKHVPYIGDSFKDIEVAEKAGLQPILVLTGNGHKTLADVKKRQTYIPIFRHLGLAVNAIINNNIKGSI